VANANKLNSTVYFFFGVFLGLTALVFFGDLVAFFAGLAASFLAAAGFLAFGFAAFFSAAGFFAKVFFGVLAFLGLAAFGFTAFFGLAAGFFLGLTTSPILNDPEAPVPFDCFKLLFLTPALSCHQQPF
jgi:hypothetical protein